MKKFRITILAVIMAFAFILMGCAGCAFGLDGRDGKDGHSVTIDEIYQKYLEETGDDISFEEFLKIYLNYTNEELDEVISLKSKINKSLMSGVTIYTTFDYLSGRNTYHDIYTGSGAILWLNKSAGDAYVVTNCHVVYDEDAIHPYCNDVKLFLYGQDEYEINYNVYKSSYFGYDDYTLTTGQDGKDYSIAAEVIGASITYDLALLKVTGSEVLKRSNAVAAEFSDEHDVKVGQTVYTIGNASDEGMSASSGIISKDSEYIVLAISDEKEYRVMRITAPINPGNSGGALYDTNGKIIGVVNSKDESDGIDNMGYALPGTSAKWLLQRMYDRHISGGTVGVISKAQLGITTVVSDSYAQFDENTNTAEIIQQLKVNQVSFGTAANGKLQSGDYIKSFEVIGSDDSVKVEKFALTREYHLREALLAVSFGDTVVLTVERNGEEQEIPIKFDRSSYFINVV